MSEALQHRAETLKLARLLGVPVDGLPSLEGLPSGEVARLREQMTDRLFDESARALARAGAAARLVPSAVVATIAHKAFGPLLSARTAAAIDPGKAVDVASRLPADFLADITVELDPRRVATMIAGVPTSLTVPVARELARRGEHVTMGRFLAYVPDEPLAAAMAALDDETLLRTAFVLEHKDRLDHAIGLLPPGRAPGILRCAYAHGLWPEALDLLSHLAPQRLGPIADDLAGLGDEVVTAMVEAACEADSWEGLLPVVRVASPAATRTLARSPAFHQERALAGIVRTAASTEGLWADLVPLLDALPEPARACVAHLAAGLAPSTLRAVLLQAADDAATTASVVDLYRLMTEVDRAAVRRAASSTPLSGALDAALAAAD